MELKAVIYERAGFPNIEFLRVIIATIRNGNVEATTFRLKIKIPMKNKNPNIYPRPANPE